MPFTLWVPSTVGCVPIVKLFCSSHYCNMVSLSNSSLQGLPWLVFQSFCGPAVQLAIIASEMALRRQCHQINQSMLAYLPQSSALQCLKDLETEHGHPNLQVFI